MNELLIFLGAGVGGVFRYWSINSINFLFGDKFPYGTLFVNVIGSFLMGLICMLFVDQFEGTESLRPLLLIGLLGGFTTFSSFSIETLTLFERGIWLNGCLNILLSVVLCILSGWLGMRIGDLK